MESTVFVYCLSNIQNSFYDEWGTKDWFAWCGMQMIRFQSKQQKTGAQHYDYLLSENIGIHKALNILSLNNNKIDLFT